MRRLRILQYTVAQSKGGRTQYILSNWRCINKERFIFDFVTFSDHLDFEDELIQEGCRVFHLSCYYKDNPSRFIEEFDEVLAQGYDVIHIHTSYWEDSIVEERAYAFGIKTIIVHSHSTGISKALNQDEYTNKVNHHYLMREKVNLDSVTHFCACSWDAAEWLFGSRVSTERITILHNGIDTKKFSFDNSIREKVRNKLGIDEDTIVIGIIGRLVYQKNQEFMIKLMAKYLYNTNTKLLIIGDGKRKSDYQNLAKQLQIGEKIEFLGHRDDIYRILQSIDIFCMPSRYDAFGIALIEAQCSNLLCVVSNEVSKESCITERVKRLPLDESKWSECLINIINEREYADRKTRIEIALNGYDVGSQVKELEKIYEE